MTTLWRSLFFSAGADAAPRSWRLALTFAAVAIGATLVLIPDLLPPYLRLGPDGHMRASLSRAINLAFCHSTKFSVSFDVPDALTTRPAGLVEPIRDVIARCCGSIAAYCGTLRIARIDNEVSLMWLMRAVLAADPSASAAAIGATFASMRLIMLALLCVALGRAGASLWMTVGVAVATGGVLRNLRIYQYNYAPFVLMLPLVLIAAYLLLLQWNPRGRAGTAAAFTGMGLVTAFGVNLRTSHTPIYLGMFILFFLAWRLVPGPAPRPSPALQGMALVLFAAGLVGSHLLLVTPVEDVAAEGVSRHLIMHPVVLALAEPPNDLSRREGLAWDDAVGDAVARRIDPAARYLTPGYGPALLQYYTSLWKRYPREMAGVYAAKFQAAGSGVFDEVADLLAHRGLPRRAGAWLASRRVPGTVMLLVAAALGCAGWLLYRRTGTLLGVALALWSVAAVGTLLESALILSRFFMPYHSVLLLYVLLTPLTLAQLAADWTRWRLVDR